AARVGEPARPNGSGSGNGHGPGPARPAAPPGAPRQAVTSRPAPPAARPSSGPGAVAPRTAEPVEGNGRHAGPESSAAASPPARPAEAKAPARSAIAPAKPDRKSGRKTPLEKTRKPRQKDRDSAVELAITEIAGHLTFTPNTVTAWYWLPEVRWAFRPDPEREALLSAISEQYAGLAGFRLHLRRTTRPF